MIIGIGLNLISSPKIINYRTTFLNKYVKNKIDKFDFVNFTKKNIKIFKMILLIDIGNTSTKVATYNIKTNKVKNYASFLTCKKNTILKIINYIKNKKN